MPHEALEIRSLTPDLLPDLLAYFEGDAFADNPKWRSCYCQFPLVDHEKVVWAERTAEQNRASACERTGAHRMQGLLAYREGKPVGWCHAAPRALMDAFASEPDPEAERIGQIACFVVAKVHRRSGVARALLEAACATFERAGLSIAEATPLAQAGSDAQAHYGPLSLYLAAGFSIHRTENDGAVRVRRRLGGDGAWTSDARGLTASRPHPQQPDESHGLADAEARRPAD